MSVVDGQPVNASYTNSKLMSRTSNTDTTGQLDLLNAGSADIIDVQQVINDNITNISDHVSATEAHGAKGQLAGTVTALVDPTVTDDTNSGYIVSSQWINTVTDAFFVCTDAAAGAAQWLEVGKTSIGIKEIPTGLINGINNEYTISHVPVDGTLLVMIDGIVLPSIEVSYSHPTITLTFPPSLGQFIEVYYLTEGNSATVQVDAGNEVVENRTVTAGEITAKQLTLTQTPSVNTNVKIDVRGGTTQIYGLDFIVTGNVVDWDGYDLDGQIIAGDIIRIVYFS